MNIVYSVLQTSYTHAARMPSSKNDTFQIDTFMPMHSDCCAVNDIPVCACVYTMHNLRLHTQRS